MKRVVKEQQSKINNHSAFYRIRLEELGNELNELKETRADMAQKFDKYLDDVEKVIERQEKRCSLYQKQKESQW